MAEVGNLLGKITDPMIIIIRIVGLMVGCFYFNIFITIYFKFRIRSNLTCTNNDIG